MPRLRWINSVDTITRQPRGKIDDQDEDSLFGQWAHVKYKIFLHQEQSSKVCSTSPNLPPLYHALSPRWHALSSVIEEDVCWTEIVARVFPPAPRVLDLPDKVPRYTSFARQIGRDDLLKNLIYDPEKERKKEECFKSC
ncbi:hypothetical protein CDAR_109471 [Caerostris darwini]|uniref:Uncharacterized protein n=1 Tax=Caerostris darwini TaxID=1538125 RepID=A0AAV4TYD0_9ARAC|nr:hypothetical protein CDAR_109471 [Caerostris darwini]